VEAVNKVRKVRVSFMEVRRLFLHRGDWKVAERD
jgi:hypothetical protein